jgi:hypothetical protein
MMKLILLVISIVLVFSQDIVVPPNGTPLEVTANAVRVRATPCTDGRIMVELNTGAVVTSSGAANTGCGYTWYDKDFG